MARRGVQTRYQTYFKLTVQDPKLARSVANNCRSSSCIILSVELDGLQLQP